MMPYKHTQIGYVVIVSMLIAAGMVIALNAPILLLIVSIVVGVLFSTLTVSVEEGGIRFWFGPGFINKQIPLEDIEACQIAKSRCWSWGIHGWPGKGWLYNVSGFYSVELKMRNGMKYYIGTDQPDDLEKAIRAAMHANFRRSLKMD